AFDKSAPNLAFQDNPNNLYASQWPLGRVVMILRKPIDTNNDGTPDTIYDNSQPAPGMPQDFITDPNQNKTPPNPPTLEPLQTGISPYLVGSTSTNLKSAGTFTVQQSRYDLA